MTITLNWYEMLALFIFGLIPWSAGMILVICQIIDIFGGDND